MEPSAQERALGDSKKAAKYGGQYLFSLLPAGCLLPRWGCLKVPVDGCVPAELNKLSRSDQRGQHGSAGYQVERKPGQAPAESSDEPCSPR